MDEREDEKKIFPWRRFSLFLYPSFRVLRRGFEMSMGRGLGSPLDEHFGRKSS